MLPVGRSGGPDPASLASWGVLAPLTADSGSIHLSRYRRGMDFFSIYDAGAALLQGADPYDISRGPVRAPIATDFRYPPTALLLAVPMNILPPWVAYACWVGFLVLLAIANFLLCAGRRPEQIPLFALLFFASFPMIAEFHLGQFSFLVGSLLLWGGDRMTRGASSGVALWGAAMFVKVYPLGMAPSLFLWGWRRSVSIVVGILVLTVVGWLALGPPAYREGLAERDLGRGFVGRSEVPYAGAQGLPSMVNAGVWKLVLDRSLNPQQPQPVPSPDPVFLINLVVIVGYGLLCLWVLWRTRRGFSLEALAIFWCVWFLVYRDCWEHHYLMFTPLVALLLAQGKIGWRLALFAWLCCGAPSLWWLWERTGYAGNFTTELIGTAYSFQRPWGPIAICVAMASRIARAEMP